MKTVIVSSRSKTLRELLKAAQSADVLLRLADGSEFLLTRLTKTESFHVGNSEDFDAELANARKNKRLMSFLEERGQRAKLHRGKSIEQIRQQMRA